MNSQDHYRDYPCDKAIEHQDYVLGLTEDRFGPPTREQIKAAAERRANNPYPHKWVEGKDGFFHKVMIDEVQG